MKYIFTENWLSYIKNLKDILPFIGLIFYGIGLLILNFLLWFTFIFSLEYCDYIIWGDKLWDNFNSKYNGH